MAAVPSDFIWPRFPVGGLMDLPFKNTSGSAMTAGMVVKLDTAHALSPTNMSAGMVPVAAVTDWPDGVVVQNTPNNANGTIQGGGFATVYQDSGGNIAVGAVVGPSGAVAGQVTTYTAGDPTVGKAWSAGTAASDPIGLRIHLRPAT